MALNNYVGHKCQNLVQSFVLFTSCCWNDCR